MSNGFNIKNYPDPLTDWLFAYQDGTKVILSDPELTYDFNYKNLDSTVKSKTEEGYLVTRPRVTRNLYIYELNFEYMTKEDTKILIGMYDIVRSSEWFYWKYPFLKRTPTPTDPLKPEDFIIKNVRYATDNRPEFSHGWWDRVNISFSLEEI